MDCSIKKKKKKKLEGYRREVRIFPFVELHVTILSNTMKYLANIESRIKCVTVRAL